MATALLVLAVAAVAFSIHTRDEAKPNAFGPYGGHGGRYTGVVGRTVYMDADVQPAVPMRHEVLDIACIKPVILRNTAAATVVVEECIRIAGTPGVGVVSSTHSLCASTRQFRPGCIDVGTNVDQIIYAITPTRTGTLRIAGTAVTYSAGTQHTGIGDVEKVRSVNS